MQELIKKHEVEFLVHFTRCENLENIFNYGLLTRSYISTNNIISVFNDSYRIDGYQDAICASISFPNYKMFYKLRKDNPDVKWAIIAIDTKVLYDKECAFCLDNAASYLERSRPIDLKKDKEAFGRLFGEYPNQVSRQKLGIDKCMTTNPQSEVLIFENLGLEYIVRVIFENENDKAQYIHYIPKNIESIVYSNIYGGRSDYDYWR